MDKTISRGLAGAKEQKDINGTMKVKQPFKKPDEGDLLMDGILDGDDDMSINRYNAKSAPPELYMQHKAQLKQEEDSYLQNKEYRDYYNKQDNPQLLKPLTRLEIFEHPEIQQLQQQLTGLSITPDDDDADRNGTQSREQPKQKLPQPSGTLQKQKDEKQQPQEKQQEKSEIQQVAARKPSAVGVSSPQILGSIANRQEDKNQQISEQSHKPGINNGNSSTNSNTMGVMNNPVSAASVSVQGQEAAYNTVHYPQQNAQQMVISGTSSLPNQGTYQGNLIIQADESNPANPQSAILQPQAQEQHQYYQNQMLMQMMYYQNQQQQQQQLQQPQVQSNEASSSASQLYITPTPNPMNFPAAGQFLAMPMQATIPLPFSYAYPSNMVYMPPLVEAQSQVPIQQPFQDENPYFAVNNNDNAYGYQGEFVNEARRANMNHNSQQSQNRNSQQHKQKQQHYVPAQRNNNNFNSQSNSNGHGFDNQHTNHTGAKNKKQNNNKVNPFLQTISAASATSNTMNQPILAQQVPSYSFQDIPQGLSYANPYNMVMPQQVVFYDELIESCKDQNTSRTIQKQFENSTPELKDQIFARILPEALNLMQDQFGNYVIQKLLEKGTDVHKEKLYEIIKGNVESLSVQTYGCRVIQKVLEEIKDRSDLQEGLVKELEYRIIFCIQDQNGNHVIQKCFETVPSALLMNIVREVLDNIHELAFHPYGCRVIQRILEFCSAQETFSIYQQLLENLIQLCVCQYGNYIIQYIIEKGNNNARDQILLIVQRNFVQLSLNKYASNVTEKSVAFSDAKYKSGVLDVLLGPTIDNHLESGIVRLTKSNYGNYVVQRLYEKSNQEQKLRMCRFLLQNQEIYAEVMGNSFGKHVLSYIEKNRVDLQNSNNSNMPASMPHHAQVFKQPQVQQQQQQFYQQPVYQQYNQNNSSSNNNNHNQSANQNYSHQNQQQYHSHRSNNNNNYQNSNNSNNNAHHNNNYNNNNNNSNYNNNNNNNNNYHYQNNSNNANGNYHSNNSSSNNHQVYKKINHHNNNNNKIY